MTSRFEIRKQNILAQLDAPTDEYHDLSPKGSVDEPIRDLIGEINTLQGLVTTSSCSGRISVFLEGRKSSSEDVLSMEDSDARAGPGGKGGGGAWLFISHDPVETLLADESSALSAKFGFQDTALPEERVPAVNSRYIHLKFEPMILHILTASTVCAQRVLTAALSAGFRESGAVSLSVTKSGESTPMVAIRSTGYSFDSIIGYHDENSHNVLLVDEKYLRTLVAIANDRFRINVERIARLQSALKDIFSSTAPLNGRSNRPGWEDADTRRQRKREEGLARQQALHTSESRPADTTQDVQKDAESIDGMFEIR